MKERSGRVVRAGARAARLVATTIAVAVLGAAGGCSSQTPVLPGTTFKVDLLETPNGVDKIDLLLVVDNSPGMAAKQAILALALPELITGLVNPKCLDDSTNLPVANQPAGPTDACPTGSTRDFAPVLDMHVGVLSSSLGSFGASACAPTDAHPCDAGISDNDFGRQTAAHPTANGWCYVDPATAPAADVAAEEARLSRCPMGEQHEVRFVGNGAPTAGATVFIACATP